MIAPINTRMMMGVLMDSTKRLNQCIVGTRLCRYSCANEMCRASSATWISMTRRMIGCRLSPSRSTFFWVWSMGSSPASTPMKKVSGATVEASGMNGDSQRSRRGIPGTSTPRRFTISWNIRVWLHSSMDSWFR
ncbi:Uncharacterised protein [Mycobacteroides abscessus subsp. abscessus]|nr:Uncharacterised protein [Mycobacteroides abscessus subsp. abscessus]